MGLRPPAEERNRMRNWRCQPGREVRPPPEILTEDLPGRLGALLVASLETAPVVVESVSGRTREAEARWRGGHRRRRRERALAR